MSPFTEVSKFLLILFCGFFLRESLRIEGNPQNSQKSNAPKYLCNSAIVSLTLTNKLAPSIPYTDILNIINKSTAIKAPPSSKAYYVLYGPLYRKRRYYTANAVVDRINS